MKVMHPHPRAHLKAWGENVVGGGVPPFWFSLSKALKEELPCRGNFKSSHQGRTAKQRVGTNGPATKHKAHLEALGPMERAQLVAAVGGRTILKEQQNGHSQR